QPVKTFDYCRVALGRYNEWHERRPVQRQGFFRPDWHDTRTGTTPLTRTRTSLKACLNSKFPTSRLEMERVADHFDLNGDGFIDYRAASHLGAEARLAAPRADRRRARKFTTRCASVASACTCHRPTRSAKSATASTASVTIRNCGWCASCTAPSWCAWAAAAVVGRVLVKNDPCREMQFTFVIIDECGGKPVCCQSVYLRVERNRSCPRAPRQRLQRAGLGRHQRHGTRSRHSSMGSGAGGSGSRIPRPMFFQNKSRTDLVKYTIIVHFFARYSLKVDSRPFVKAPGKFAAVAAPRPDRPRRRNRARPVFAAVRWLQSGRSDRGAPRSTRASLAAFSQSGGEAAGSGKRRAATCRAASWAVQRVLGGALSNKYTRQEVEILQVPERALGSQQLARTLSRSL
uniref:EF-hand domain-containing protein n=1 Tax=Macrostomum lignano TaxID=282301 RepID=A0A1I8JNM2_9PLAT